ncbi:MAG: ABC transporter ATP-binding protein [Candidatus Delongbacteria bacterium]|jgi:ABC-2 type transport system ATP-binding protein|nr:ABC transporter ATP-binding protein [Candidatus Delongbacteria bacterium]
MEEKSYMNNAIEIKGLVKKYKKLSALDNVNIDIKENLITAFIGPNGSGKTTLLKIILNIIDLDQGEVRFIQQYKMGFLSDEFIPYEHLTVRDNLRAFSKLKRIPSKEISSEVERVLLITFLTDEKNKLYKDLSSGMKKKFHFGLALLGKPKLLILDEPFSALDLVGRKDFIAILKYLKEKRDTTIILSSHDLTSISDFCDEIVFMKKGKIILEADSSKSLSYLNEKYMEYFEDDIEQALSNL